MPALVRTILFSTFTFATGLIIGKVYFAQTTPSPALCPPAKTQEVRQLGSHYTSPLLECEAYPSGENITLAPLKHKLNQQIEELYRQGNITRVAIYYRDLMGGPWFGINQDDNFSPASLLKTPLMLAYLKAAEDDIKILENKLKYNPQDNAPEMPNQKTPSLKPQATYTVQELIDRMIIDSDNNAFNILALNLDYNKVKKVHEDLGLAIPDATTPEDFISVKQYASIFRVLFNSSYLSRGMSEKALSTLAHASYQDALVAGVPKDVEVAHKYGVRHGDDGVNQLHDCGIVYLPNRPYLLCIMTKGQDFKDLTSTIRNLSKYVYEHLTSN